MSSAARAWVNGLAFALPDKVTHMTGAQVRALPIPSIRDTDDLFVKVPGDEDLLVQFDEVVPVVGREFFSVPKVINAGSSAATVPREQYGRVVAALDQAVEALDIATAALQAEGKLPDRAILSAKLLHATRELRGSVGAALGDDDG